jgi:lipoyl synthase
MDVQVFQDQSTSIRLLCHGCRVALVLMHAVYTQVERLQSTVRDRRANWNQSIAVLEAAKMFGARITKTSIMLGCGEKPEEVLATLQALRKAGRL